jgi:Tat protein translocase TatB subunit
MDIFSNIGSGELLFILIIVLLVMGPHRLPQVARTLGQALHKLQGVYQEFIAEFEEELRTVEETTKEVRYDVQTLQETVKRELIDELPPHTSVRCEKTKEDETSDG